jgi:hypothetical protein
MNITYFAKADVEVKQRDKGHVERKGSRQIKQRYSEEIKSSKF